MIQGMEDKVSFMGMAGNVALTADAPRAEVNLAKAVLMKLHESRRDVNWHVDIQSDVLTIHSDRHLTFSYRTPLSALAGKGFNRLRHIGREMIERIEAGAC